MNATYELASVTDSNYEHVGDYERADDAYAAALALGAGSYAGTRDIDGGHYEEEIVVTEDDRVLVRNAGESDWSEWDG